jgi:hypothetical protein
MDSDSTITITVEDVEALATRLESGQAARREKLLRLIRAHARILAVREPETFTRRAIEYSDEDGHWDNSYPPKKKYKDRSGPRTLKIREYTWEEIATSSGFYFR